MISLYWYVVVGILSLCIYFHFTGKPVFWKLTRKYPYAALRFFESEPENWLVFYEKPPDGYRSVAPAEQWCGPFIIYVPSLPNPTVVIFGRDQGLEASQERFVAMVKSGKLT